MKTRFNTYDIICMVTELQSLIGMRVNQVYDIDNKTYVIRLQRSEEKRILLLESANRFHTTHFEWPKNVAPSGFTMKLRKHLKNKRLEKFTQLGIDRIIDLQFGSGEAAYHVILELYDRGNIVLTDYEWTILNVLRPHVEGDKIRFAVKEKYPLDRAKTNYDAPSSDALLEILSKSKPGDNLRKILNPNLEFGSAIIDHVLLENGLSGNMKISKEPGKGFNPEYDLEKLVTALKQAEQLLDAAKNHVSKGYITQKKEERPNPDGEGPNYLITNVEFHPMLYTQHKGLPYAEYETFDRAVDEFFSALEGQKIDLKTVQVEREAMKKLQNVRKDHDKRVTELQKVQVTDEKRAELITRNQVLVDQARAAVQAALAKQMSWEDVKESLKVAQKYNDPIASCIKHLKLNINHITLLLSDPFIHHDDEDDEERLEPMLVDIDLSLTAFANARRYYDQKRSAAKKQQKTLESAGKALKSAERKTKQTLKEAHTISNIIKARKTYWFEKFYWFISSDNYLVIAGRDQQQNELLVKRYMRSTDIYVHADVTGASSVVIKNPTGGALPPKTLAEAGQAAVGYSVAWEAKVLTRAWWVQAHQVSKSAPTGEYLSTGSFMIRGKKNYLLPDQLQFGFSFMFRLEDSCIEKHKDERKSVVIDDKASDVTSVQDEDQEILVSDDDEDSDKDDKKEAKLDTIKEERNVSEGTKDLNDKLIDISLKDDNGDENKENDKYNMNDNEKEDEKSDSESDDESSKHSFPNTHIKVDHETGKVMVESKTRTISEMSEKSDDMMPSFPALPKKGGKVNKKPQKEKEQKKDTKKEESKVGLKRGQKSKLKKIKEKYKDQDDEDRQLMLEWLKSRNESKEKAKAGKKGDGKSGSKSKSGPKPVKVQPVAVILEASDEEPEPDVTTTDQQGPDADTEMLSQLTGSPFLDDELLFAVPVVAPYSALNNYKYRVKLTPGTSKRGKAAKTAIQVFLRDPSSTSREKDLLKAVKEENVARNFPGKVKLSAPQLHKHKK